MNARTARSWLALILGAGPCGIAHAERPEFAVSAEVQQFVEDQLSGDSGDDAIYTEVAGTASARFSNRRLQMAGTYRLAYRIGEWGDVDENVAQDGLLRMEAKLVDEWLTLDAGAISTRSRVDPAGPAPQFNGANAKNLAQTYSIYVQPALAHHVGDLDFAASYLQSYTTNDSKDAVLSGTALANRFESARNQEAQLIIGMERGELPFDWKVTSQYRRENATALAQHLRSKSVIGEITIPLTGSLAYVGSAGYESTTTSQRSALVDPGTGLPVTTRNGRFIADPASPRFLTYDVAGLIADAGVVWRPSRRTRAEIRAGRRYGDLSVTALIQMRPSERTGLTLAVTDRIQSFAQDVSSALSDAPTNLDLDSSVDPGRAFQHCLFGKTAGEGRCLGGALGQASGNTYRERAASLLFVHRMRRWNLATTLGYSHRTYIDVPGTLFSLDGVVDQSFYGSLEIAGRLNSKSGVSFSFNGNMFKNGQAGTSDVVSGLFSTSYYRTFGRGLRAQARFSVDASKEDGDTADVEGRAQLGVRYDF